MRVPIRLTVLTCMSAIVPACRKENAAMLTENSTDPVVREPLDTNDTLEGRARNRRVKLTLD